MTEQQQLRKLAAVREAAKGAYPVGDIGSMLGEIEGGYGLAVGWELLVLGGG